MKKILLAGILILLTACSARTEKKAEKKNVVQIKAKQVEEEVLPSYITWKFKTDGKVHSNISSDNESIYFGTDSGFFYKLDKLSGNKIWEKEFGKLIKAEALIDEDRIYIVSGERLICIDKNTGEEFWRYEPKVKRVDIRDYDDWDYHRSKPVIDSGRVYYGNSIGEVIGFDKYSGKEVWKYQEPSKASIRSDLKIVDGKITVADWNGNLYLVDIEKNERVWKYSAGALPIMATPYYYNGVLYFSGRDATMHAVDYKTGKDIWTWSDPNKYWISGGAVVHNDKVYIGGSDGHKIYVYNKDSGEYIKEIGLEYNVFSNPVIVDNRMYIAEGNAYSTVGTGNFYIIDLDSDKEISKTTVKGNIYTGPLIEDTRVWLGNEKEEVYLIDLNKI